MGKRLLTMFGFLTLFCAGVMTQSAPVRADDTLTVAVTYFQNNATDKYAHLARGIADMLVVDLAVSRDIRLVERNKLDNLVKELKLSRTRLIDKKTALKMGKILAADLILTGSIVSVGLHLCPLNQHLSGRPSQNSPNKNNPSGGHEGIEPGRC